MSVIYFIYSLIESFTRTMQMNRFTKTNPYAMRGLLRANWITACYKAEGAITCKQSDYLALLRSIL